MNSFLQRPSVQLSFLAFVVFLSRLPFLQAGFGSEEDSWLLPLTAKNIALTGQYELSRAPGHPLQELIYAWMYNDGLSAFAVNLLSAIASVIAAVFFALALKRLEFRHYLFAAFAFAFTPVVFISSTYTIDYMLAMAFVMGSFYFIASPLPGFRRGIEGEVIAGILLGIAIGFRLTSGAMLAPFCILIFASDKNMKRIFVLVFITAITGLLTYVPVIKTYGLSFFTFADQFPYPNFPKVTYKATIGAFGTIGILALAWYKFKVLSRIFSGKQKFVPNGMPKAHFYVCCAAIIIYLISYLRLPQKSAYFIPMIPFVLLLAGYYLSSREYKVLCVLMTMSSFLFSMNLTDPIRGSNHSALATKFNIAGQEIFLDPLTGPVYADYTKRLNKMAYTETVFQKISGEQRKAVLICGWWYNELLVRGWKEPENQHVVPVFYIDRPTMEKYQSGGYTLFYLPEQNLCNDQYSQINYTDSVAAPYM